MRGSRKPEIGPAHLSPCQGPPLSPITTSLMATSSGSRPWLITTIVCGGLLVGAIITGLSSSLSKLGRTMDLMDQPGTHPGKIAHLADESARTTRLSLWCGTPVALIYITSLVMYRRSRKPR